MATKKVVTDSLVNDVIAGKYGNGAERQKKLSELNYDYKEVNAAVTAKLNEGNSSSSGSKPATQTSSPVTQPAVGNTGGSDVSIGQSSADAQLAEQMRQQQEAYDNLVAYQQEMYNESKKQAAVNRENANRNAYISREIAVKNLPDQLAAQGINGGLSESSMVRLHNNYARTLAQNDLQYNDTVANAYRQMLANKADIESNRPTGGVISGSGAGNGANVNAGTPSGSSGGYLPVTDEIVQAVIAGKYGNGEERKQKLTAAGYDYKAVNAAVTAAMSTGNSGGNNYDYATLKAETDRLYNGQPVDVYGIDGSDNRADTIAYTIADWVKRGGSPELAQKLAAQYGITMNFT